MGLGIIMTEIQEYLPGILLSLSAVMLALMSPGSNILAVIGTSMGVGRRQGISLALGVGCGTFLWVSLAVLGFTAVISKYALIAGQGYLGPHRICPHPVCV